MDNSSKSSTGNAVNTGGLRARAWLVVLVIGLPSLIPSIAVASTAQEERQGSTILNELESERLQCDDASAEDFARAGEFAMGRMLGSTNSHEAMDEAMSRMMGSDGEPQIHEAMGRRFTGCDGGQLPSGFNRMMGAFNAMGMMGSGMMGGPPQGPFGSMMSGYGSQSSADDDDFEGPSAAAMVGMMAILIGAVAVAALLLPRRRPPGPLDTLKQRYAESELTNEEYEERRQLLEGSQR